MSDYDKIRKYADDNGLDYRDDYSGRSMYGKTCISISVESKDVLDTIVKIGVTGAHIDQLGKRDIIYWPAISATTRLPPGTITHFVAKLHPCKCTAYNGGQCYNCMNGAHSYCTACGQPNDKQIGIVIQTKSTTRPKKKK